MNLRKEYQAALALRLEGKTYGEIRILFGIPKSTLSTWFSALELNNKAKKILDSKKKNGYFKLLEFNKVRTLNIQKENENSRKNFASRISKLSKREIMILGAALYWAEGYKNHNHKRRSYPYLLFANSDPNMVKIFIRFLEEILGIPRIQLAAAAMIYPNLDPEQAVNYWQKITGIPKDRVHYYKALSRASQGKRPKNLLPYGTLQIRVNDRLNFFKTMGLIDGIIKNI